MKNWEWFVVGFCLIVVCLAVASEKDIPYPIPEEACGAWGNNYGTAQAMRNGGTDLHETMFSLLESEKECEQKLGEQAKDKCLLPDESSKGWALQKLKDMWSAKPKDPMTSGFDEYNLCLQSNRGKSL